MKAAILVEQNAPLEVAVVDIPSVDVGQVLVKVEYSGVCGTQLEEIAGTRGEDPYLPHLLGHEGTGIVQEVGPGVRKVKPNDHVVLHWMRGSGIEASPPKYFRHGSVVNAGGLTTFSEYTLAAENRVTAIGTDVDMEAACLLGCAVTTGLGIVFNNLGLLPGQSIAVFGVGGVGLNVVQGANLVNAYPIVAIDLHDDKLEQSVKFGATHTVNSSKCDPADVLRDLMGGRGFDATVDLTGNNTVRQLAYNLTGAKGKTVLAGVPHHNQQINIDSFPLHFGRKILGSQGGDTWPDVDIPRYLQLYQLGKLKLQEQITHRYSLDQINDAIDLVRSGRSGRCVISMSQTDTT